MGTVCQKCGDPGFTVALIYCYCCQKVAEHRYCLDVTPKTFTEYVVWFCEDCKAKDDAEVCYLLPKRNRNPDKSKKKKRKLESKSTLSPVMNSNKEEGDVTYSSVDNDGNQFCQPCVVPSPQSCASDKTDNDKLEASTECNVNSYNNFRTKPPKSIMDSASFVASTSQVFVLSQPIYEPIWRGHFILRAGEFGVVNGITAHLSTKASFQVYQEAQLLSKSLCPALLPRVNIWPKDFVKSGPKDENIDLYFFPRNKRYEKEYDILVDCMVHFDLALKAVGENTDLLIFSSSDLPLNKRFEAKYYLWGVFSHKGFEG